MAGVGKKGRKLRSWVWREKFSGEPWSKGSGENPGWEWERDVGRRKVLDPCVWERDVGKKVLDARMWRRPALGLGKVKLSGTELLAVTQRRPGLHAERKIERWENACMSGRLSFGFREKKTCGSGELHAKKGGSHGLGRVQRTQVAGTSSAVEWKRPLGGVEGVEWRWRRGGGGDPPPPSGSPVPPACHWRQRFKGSCAAEGRGGLADLERGAERAWLQPSCTTATRTHAGLEPAGHSVT